MSRENNLSEVISVLVTLGCQGSLDYITPEEVPVMVREAEEINRLHWNTWSAAMKSVSTDDVVAVFKALTVVECVLNWCGGSVAAPVWVFHELERRDIELSRVWADWALARTRNAYIPFGTSNMGARSLDELAERKARWAERKAEIAAQERERAERGARQRLAGQLAHRERMERQLDATNHRRNILAQMETLAVQERLRRIAEDDAHPVSFYPEAFAEANLDDLAVLDTDTLQKLKDRTAESGSPGWKRLHRRLLNRDI